MVTARILPFRENSHGRAGNRTRDLMISSQRLWPLDHEAGLISEGNLVKILLIYYFSVLYSSETSAAPLSHIKNLHADSSNMSCVIYLRIVL